MTVEELFLALGPLLGQRTAVEGPVRDWPVMAWTSDGWVTPFRVEVDEGRVILSLDAV